MSVKEFIRVAAPAADWLEKAWAGTKRRGLDLLTPREIDAEFAASRKARRQSLRKSK